MIVYQLCHITKIISYLCRIFAEDLHVTSRVTRTSLIETKKYLKLLLLTCYSHNTCIVIWLNDCETKYILHVKQQCGSTLKNG